MEALQLPGSYMGAGGPGHGQPGGCGPRLAEREYYVLRLVLQLRLRGLGSYRIGRLLWPSLKPRTAQKRVQRVLERAARMGIPVEDPEEALAYVSACSSGGLDAGVETGAYSFDETSRRRVSIGEDNSVAPALRVPRLGPTQRIVLAALYSLGGRARFSTIVNMVLELLGLDGHLLPRARLRNRVWQALRRLAARDLVGFHDGVYWLSSRLGGPGLFVENFRVETLGGVVVQVWSKRDHGYAAPLAEALALAVLRGSWRTVQVEVSEILGGGLLEELMDSLGVSIIKVYRDPSPPFRSRAKLEIAFDRPPLRPWTTEINSWARAFQAVKSALVRVLRR